MSAVETVQDSGHVREFSITASNADDSRVTVISCVLPHSVNVVEVIDHSGSMGDSSGAGTGTKLDAAKDAADMFVDMLNVGDKIGVVGYSDTATVDYPLTAVSNQVQTVFSDPMDTAANWRADSPWGLTASTSHSGGLCFTDSPAGDYANHADTSLNDDQPDYPPVGTRCRSAFGRATTLNPVMITGAPRCRPTAARGRKLAR